MADTMTTENALEQMATLAGALPFLKRYDDQIIVVKYGGHAMGEEETALRFGRDVALLEQVGVNPVVVHGGGPQINAMLKRLNVQSTFVQGLRVTDAAMLDVVEMVLAGPVNKQVAEAITRAGAIAVGISGKDGGLIRARKLLRTVRDPGSRIEQELDLGYVGEPESVDTRVLDLLIGASIVPVVAPVGVGADGQTYNINADTVAGAIAGALGAERLLMMTDVVGVLDRDGKLVPELTVDEVRAGIEAGWISGGMIPKVETCVAAVRGGVKGAVILDGRVPHAVLRELFTDAGRGDADPGLMGRRGGGSVASTKVGGAEPAPGRSLRQFTQDRTPAPHDLARGCHLPLELRIGLARGAHPQLLTPAATIPCGIAGCFRLIALTPAAPHRQGPPPAEAGRLPTPGTPSMDTNSLRPRIEALWERRDTLSPSTGGEDRAQVEAALEALDSGQARVAEPDGQGGWRVNQWLKQAVLLSFRLTDSAPMDDPAGARLRQGAAEVRRLGRRTASARPASAPCPAPWCAAPPTSRPASC